MAKLTENDQLIAYLLGNIPVNKLSKNLQLKLDRLYACDNLIRQYGSRPRVIRMMVTRFTDEYKQINKTYSRRTAESDYSATQQIFGTLCKHDINYHVDILLERISETRHLAKITQNATALARCDANYQKAIQEFMGDKDVPDYEQIQIPDQVFIPDPKLLESYTRLPSDEELMKQIQLLEAKPKNKMPQLKTEHIELAKIVEEYEK
ncbi:MAG: hypothetical protein ACPGJS_00590 [Flammeovirgaceae bacterium]